MTDTGSFQINDIDFVVPPENIRVMRNSSNNYWSTLRTRSSIKLSSEYSQIDIAVTIQIVDQGDELKKLRDLVSQIRVTPFCWVENAFIRKSVLGLANDKNDQAMVLALKQLEIVDAAGSDTNVLTLNLMFSWFNYFPYSNDFIFREDIFIPKGVRNPKHSKAWRLLYKAEQMRGPYPGDAEVGHLSTPGTEMFVSQYMLVAKKMFNALRSDIAALKEMDSEIVKYTQFTPAIGTSEFAGMPGALIVQVKEQLDMNIAPVREVWNTSSFIDLPEEAPRLEDVKSVLRGKIASKEKELASMGVLVGEGTDWNVTTDKRGSIIEWHDRLDITLEEAAKGEGTGAESKLLMQKEEVFAFDDMGLIITGISISFENTLATIPMTGHCYPTFQHIGSTDGIVSLSILTPHEDGIAALATWYNMVESQGRKMRQVPAGMRNIRLRNELVNLCGLKEFIVEDMSTSTVPGKPGTYSAVFTLVDNPVTPETQEKLVAGTSFTSSYQLRNAVLDVLGQSLEFVSDAFSFNSKSGFSVDSDKLPIVGKARVGVSGLGSVAAAALGPVLGLAGLPLIGAGDLAPDDEGSIHLYNRDVASSYRYGGTRDGTEDAYANSATQYGLYLHLTMLEVLKYLNLITESSIADLAFMLINVVDGNAVAGKRLAEDLLPFIQERRAAVKIGPTPPPKGFGSAPVRTAGLAGVVNFEPVIAPQKNVGLVLGLWEKVGKGEDLSSEEREQLNTLIADRTKETHDIASLGPGQEAMNLFTGKVSELADRILNSELIELKQFESVRELISASTAAGGNNAYPDFPLSQVVNALQQDDSYDRVAQYLEDTHELENLGLYNIGIASLINPDFYLYNPQIEGSDKLIGNDVINAAKTAIITVQGDKRFQAEDDWLTEVYEGTIIGPDRAGQIREDVVAGGPSRDADRVSTRIKKWAEWLVSKTLPESRKTAINTLKSRAADSRTTEAGKKSVLVAPDQEGALSSALSTLGGMALKKITLGADLYLETIKTRPQKTMTGARGAEVAQHRFGIKDTLDHLPASSYVKPPPSLDPNADPEWGWPTSESENTHISSHFGVVRGGISTAPHRGIDIVRNGGPGNTSKLLTVLAAADGKIEVIPDKYLTYNETWGEYKESQGRDPLKLREKIRLKQHDTAVTIRLIHAGGYRTVYTHLQWPDEPMIQALSKRFYESNEPVYVKKGDPLGKVGNTGYSTGAHLHFEVRANANKTSVLPPLEVLDSEFHKSPGPIVGFDPTNESLFTKSVEQLEKDLIKTQGYSIMRAYPTFKLYFIESDEGERKKYKFDDFFGYSSVVDIEVVRNKKLPADLAIIRLTNVSGVLSNRKFQGQGRETEPRKADDTLAKESLAPGAANTGLENPIASLMLQPGIAMQLRLGYDNQPDELEKVLNGVITDVSFSPSDDIIEITCQSYGIELVQNVYGDVKEFSAGWFSAGDSSTATILEEMMAAPEITHFGRWDPADPKDKSRALLTNKWEIIPTPADDNIFAPTGNSGLNGLYDNTVYKLYRATAWDVIQEMTLRHPGWIAYPVPYDDVWGARMTLFFGLPNQLYFARKPTGKEDRAYDSVSKFVDKSVDALEEVTDATKANQSLSKRVKAIVTGKAKTVDDDLREVVVNRALLQMSKDRGIIKPFRNYHVLTSTQHIIHNDIKSTSWNTFNICTVQYEDDEPSPDEKTQSLKLDEAETFTLRVDDAIPDEEKREMFASYPNCIGEEAAKRYAQSLLKESMGYGYRGSIIIIGNPRIKPYDICYVLDEYNDMFGPIEVEQVVHKFSQQHGFITEITPCMCVHVNEVTTMASMDAMGLIAEHALNKIGLRSLPGVSTGGHTVFVPGLGLPNPLAAKGLANSFAQSSESVSFGALATTLAKTAIVGAVRHNFIGTFILDKLLTRSQLAHPLRFSPLVLQGKPMLGGVPTRSNKGSFAQSVARWSSRTRATSPLYAEHLYDKINPNNWFRPQGSFSAWLTGTER